MTTTPTFDPTSSSSTTASIMSAAGLCCLSLAGFNMGRMRDDKASPIYTLSWWTVPSATLAFCIALVIFFMYD